MAASSGSATRSSAPSIGKGVPPGRTLDQAARVLRAGRDRRPLRRERGRARASAAFGRRSERGGRSAEHPARAAHELELARRFAPPDRIERIVKRDDRADRTDGGGDAAIKPLRHRRRAPGGERHASLAAEPVRDELRHVGEGAHILDPGEELRLRQHELGTGDEKADAAPAIGTSASAGPSFGTKPVR